MKIWRFICDRCNQEHNDPEGSGIQVTVGNAPARAGESANMAGSTVYSAGDFCKPCITDMVRMILSFEGDRFTGKETR